jgi:mannose-6-phosphate isomerase-like protein (cupin superfamily)
VTEGVSFARLDFDTPDRFQTLRRELGVTTFGFNFIVLQPGQRGRIHHHAHQEEVYVVLQGRLTLVIEGEERDLDEGGVVRVAPDVRRQLVNRGPGRVAVLAMGSAHAHEGRDGIAYATWDTAVGSPPQETPLPDDLPAADLRTD